MSHTPPDPSDALSLKAALRLLWRLGWQEPTRRRQVRRFFWLYVGVVGSALLAGAAVLLIVLGVLRGLFLSAPLYPALNEALHRWGWPGRGIGWQAAPSRARALHTVLWAVLSGLAVAVGLFYLWRYGFCAQNLFCRAGLWP